MPDALRGRISSFMMMSVSLPLLGTLPVGALADRIFAPAAVSIACAAGALFVVVLHVASPTLRSLDQLVADGEALPHSEGESVRHRPDSVPSA